MSDDASLTDFAGGDDGDEAEDSPNESDSSERPAGSESVATPTFTYTSTPSGAECAACGAVVEERWHAGEGGTADDPDLAPDALVCPDCKEW